MKILIFVLIAGAVFGYFFWDDLFGTDSGDRTTSTPPENGVEQASADGDEPEELPVIQADPIENGLDDLLSAGRWVEAARIIETRKAKGGLCLTDRLAYYRCLRGLERPNEAATVFNELCGMKPLPADAVEIILDAADRSSSLLEKRRLLGTISNVSEPFEEKDVERLVKTVDSLNLAMPRSILGLFEAETYVVKPNDSLWEICRDYNRKRKLNVEVGLIRWLNGIESNNIYPDQSLKLPKEKLSIKVWTNSWLLCVFLGDSLLSAYKVGLGKDNKTPLGLFVIESKLENPTWNSRKLGKILEPGDPENVLGTRWLGFKNSPQFQGYGLHGTEEPESIGKNMSDGCIRLLNEDVEELFEIVSRGTSVEIS